MEDEDFSPPEQLSEPAQAALADIYAFARERLVAIPQSGPVPLDEFGYLLSLILPIKKAAKRYTDSKVGF